MMRTHSAIYVTINNITRRAVLLALDEYDSIGEEAFLRKYGFGKALKYFLIHNGRPYHSKAVLGAAHGYEFLEVGPLLRTDFSGGETQTTPWLRALGFPIVTREEWSAMESAGGYDQESGEDLQEIQGGIPRRRGQGRGLTAPQRRAVELRAMELAKEHYRAYWKQVKDVGDRCSYDLDCRTGADVLHVEVKGTTGAATSVLLTRNEVEHARVMSPNVALFVVSQIALGVSGTGEPTATGGVIDRWEPWQIDDGALRPTTYEYRLPAR